MIDTAMMRRSKASDLKRRTLTFGLRVLKLVEQLPATRGLDVVTRQLIRAATGVGANYRAACRARSPADFVSKISVTEEEADEAAYWLTVLQKGGFADGVELDALCREANELTAIFTASGRTARQRAK
jgi:four helix bundle protein